MDNDQKEKFVADLVASVLSSVTKDIHNGRVPDEWNGIELRRLLAFRFSDECIPMDKKREREFLRILSVNNL